MRYKIVPTRKPPPPEPEKSGSAMSKPTKPPKQYICKYCQYVFKRSEHLTRHERSHTQEKPFGCSVCNCQFSRKDLVVRHERMIHFERKSTARITAKKARKYEPRRPSQSSDIQEDSAPSTATEPSRKRSLTTTDQLTDPSTDDNSCEEQCMFVQLPNIFDDQDNFSMKRSEAEADQRPSKVRIISDDYSQTNGAPVAPMFGRPNPNSSGALNNSNSPRTLDSEGLNSFALDPVLGGVNFGSPTDQEQGDDSVLQLFGSSADRQGTSDQNQDPFQSSLTYDLEPYFRSVPDWRSQLEEGARAPT